MKKPAYEKMFSLKGRTAIVTGGAGILGRRFCEGLAAFGANVAVADLSAGRAEALAKRLRGVYGVKAAGIACDVTDPASVRRMTALAKKMGPVTILHNNAASKSSNPDEFFKPFERYSLKAWRDVMSVNLDGMFLVAQEVGRLMREQKKGGSVIQTASIYGAMAPDQRIYKGSSYRGRGINTPAVYTASKAGVIGLTKHLASLWARHGIRVNTLTPGGVRSGQNRTFVKKYSARVPMARMAEPDEMVGALIYLASDASSYVTGHNLIIDGGLNSW